MQRSRLYKLFIVLTLLATSLIQESSDKKQMVFPSPDLEGRNFVPIKLSQTEAENTKLFREAHVPTDLSNWERLKTCDELEIETVRVFGFQKLSEEFSLIDEHVKDKIYLRNFKEAVSSKYVMRPCESDVGRSFGAYGGGVYVGVLEFRFKGTQEPVIVGVGQKSFYLDVWYGSNRQTFYSNALAVVLSKFLSEKFNLTIQQEMFDDISGKSRFEFRWREEK